MLRPSHRNKQQHKNCSPGPVVVIVRDRRKKGGNDHNKGTVVEVVDQVGTEVGNAEVGGVDAPVEGAVTAHDVAVEEGNHKENGGAQHRQQQNHER
jgi:hypothetical protein